MLERVIPWIRSLLLRRRLEREMREEMAAHLERATTRLRARGLSADEARCEAMREFGNVVWLQEEARYARGTVWLDALSADLRFAVRHFGRAPWTTLAMFVVLVGGLSISVLLFSFMWSYAFEPPPGIEREEDLVRLRGSRSAGGDNLARRSFTREELDGYRRLSGHFDAVSGWMTAPVVLGVDAAAGGALRATAVFVTENYFSVLGIRPVLGPGLPTSATDPSASMVGVIGHSAWVQLYGRDPGVLGSVVMVNGAPIVVVGVAPELFRGASNVGSFQLWLPQSSLRVLIPDARELYHAAGRLRPGVSASAATAAARVVASRSAESSDELRSLDPSVQVVPLLARNNDPEFERDIRLNSVLVGTLGLLVLLIACTNASTLLTGLATARRREIAIRLSLGAARRRLIRQCLTESALLACTAALVALGIAWACLRVVTVAIPTLPFELGINWPATTFTLAVALSVGVLFGLAPALHATRLALSGVLRDSSATIVATPARLQRGLVVTQVAFTQPLLVLLTAVLLVLGRAEWSQPATDIPDRVIAVGWSMPSLETGSDGNETMKQLNVMLRRVASRLKTTSGVDAVALQWGTVSRLGSFVGHDGRTSDAPPDAVRLFGAPADSSYFAVMGIPLIRGRSFAATDAASQSTEVAAIVSDDLARRVWGSADPIGRRLYAVSDTASTRDFVVIGVIDAPGPESTSRPDGYRVYFPADTTGDLPPALLIRTAGAAAPMVPMVRKLLGEDAPPGVFAHVGTLAEADATDNRTIRNVAAGISIAGLMALLLSAIGLYAVVAFAVGQRMREIAIRIAVGGGRQQIVRHFVQDGLRLSAMGLLIGLPVGLITLRVLIAVLEFPYYVALPNVTTIAAIAVITVATAAVWIPARRAASVDPAATLRRE